MIEKILEYINQGNCIYLTAVFIAAIIGSITATYKYIENHYKLKIQLAEAKVEELLNKKNSYIEKDQLFEIFDFSGENSESEKHLLDSLENAKEEIFVFGLTRNFYSDDKIQKILIKKSKEIPIKIIMMDPDGKSKKERYRLEPSRAAYRNSNVYKEKVEKVFLKLIRQSKKITISSRDPGICFCYYDFPCSFAMEKIDNQIRVFLYGYGKRGTDSPTFVFHKGHPSYEYFNSQIDWMKEIGRGEGMPQWDDSNITFTDIANKSLERNI
jgi:hypothetical protein